MSSRVRTYLESCDVARAINRSTSYVKHLAMVGRLRVAARTSRGVRLFEAADVEDLRKSLPARQRRRAA